MSLLGIDIGTTGCKALIFNLEGKVLSSAYREYPLLYSKEGWIELDPERVWHNTKEAIKSAVEGAKKDKVKALSLSSLGEAVTPLGKKGETLARSIIGFDLRGRESALWWEKRVGKSSLFKITGMPLNNTYTINKILWWKKKRKEVFKKAKKFLCYEDFAIFRLGLPPTIDYSLAARTMAFDIKEKKWSRKILNLSGIDEDLLPEVKPSGEIVGELPSKVARELSLPAGVKVVTGGHDQPAGALGSGIIKEGIAMDATGTVECVTAAFKKPILNQKMLRYNFCCYPHVVKDMFITLAFNFTGGSLLRWYRDVLGKEEVEEAKRKRKDAYEVIINKARKEPSALFVLPHFTTTGTPYFDPYSRGLILGLGLQTTKSDLIKAILEGITWEIKLNLELLSKAGVKISELRAIGGGAKSSLWLQLKADMYGKKLLSLNTSEAACLGVALLAGVAIGEYNSLEEAVRTTIRVRKVFTPDLGRQKEYQERLKTYLKLYPLVKGLKPLNPRLKSGRKAMSTSLC